MTTFDTIYNNCLGYRNEYEQLISHIFIVINEKQKQAPLISWFRQRRRIANRILDPACFDLAERIKNSQKDTANSILLINKALEALEDNNREQTILFLKRLNERSSIDIQMFSDNRVITEFLELEKNKLLTNQAHVEDTYMKTIKHIQKINDTIMSANHAKDIDISAFTKSINDFLRIREQLNIDVEQIPQIPLEFNQKVIEDQYAIMRDLIKKIDSRYPMKLFKNCWHIERLIIHDISNDRGQRAFKNRAVSLMNYANDAITTFNEKYWQITGQRWEKRGPENMYSYVSVKATHSNIPLIK